MPEPAFQFAFQNLSGRPLRQILNEFDTARPLVAGDSSVEPCQQPRLFERLAGVGLSRKGDIPQSEPDPRARQEPRIQATEQQRPQVAQMPVTSAAQPAYDDDQLEIPAFLRRQAN